MLSTWLLMVCSQTLVVSGIQASSRLAPSMLVAPAGLAPGASGATLVSQVTPPPKFPVLSVEFLGRVFFLGRVETLGSSDGLSLTGADPLVESKSLADRHTNLGA